MLKQHFLFHTLSKIVLAQDFDRYIVSLLNEIISDTKVFELKTFLTSSFETTINKEHK